MISPVYETDADRDRQMKAITRIADIAGMNAVDYSKQFGRTDFDLWRKGDRNQKIVIAAEVKGVVRFSLADCPFPTLIIDRAKLDALEARARSLGAIPIVFFYFEQCETILSRRGPFGHYPTEWKERKDRGDPNDRDLCSLIPIADCKKFS